MSASAVVEKSMGRKRTGRPPTSERDDIVVKLDRALAAQARYIAETRGISMAEYLTAALQPIVSKDFQQATKGGSW
jgi:hypothetical protein